MFELLDVEALGIPVVWPGEAFGASCPRCEAYRPSPLPDGSLHVDPDIRLPSPGMGVEIAFHYNSSSDYNGPFGYGRTISLNLLAQASGDPALVTLTHASGARVTFQDDGGGNYVCGTPNVLNTLSKDQGNSLWKETTPDGVVTAYPLDTTGAVTSVVWCEDACANRHTFSYQSGRLGTLEDAVGRKVTLSYDGNGLLASVEDWAGRRTTLAYDTQSVSGKPLLATVTGPAGCQTGYGYDGTPRLTRITDPNGYDTSYAYDASGRVTTMQVPAAPTESSGTKQPVPVPPGGPSRSYAYYDELTVTADMLGVVSSHTLDTNFAVMSSKDPLGNVVAFTRNSLGQETTRQDALGAVSTTLYDASGLEAGSVDALGNITTIQRDAHNNPTTFVYADGSVVAQIYGYGGSSFDTTGSKRRLQARVDALGYRTSMGYDARGSAVWQQDPTGAITSYGYDGFGNRITVTDPLGHVTTRVYDAAGVRHEVA